jgi:hypothetical protein
MHLAQWRSVRKIPVQAVVFGGASKHPQPATGPTVRLLAVSTHTLQFTHPDAHPLTQRSRPT